MTARLIVATVLLTCVPPSAKAGTWVYDSFTNSAGSRAFQLYVPTGYAAGQNRALLVGIHGCTETPAELAGLTRITQLADANHLLILLPAQDSSANSSLCWNWFLAGNQKRGQGEPSLIKGMVDWVKARYSVDASRVYVYGVSSGGYMASIMLSCYSDVFAAGMVASGGMYEAASDVFSAAFAALYGSSKDPRVSGDDAYRCSGSVHPRRVPLLVFHGSEDTIVAPVNGQQTVDQFLRTNDWGDDGIANDSIAGVPSSSQSDTAAGGLPFTWQTYTAGGQTLIQQYIVIGMAHAWSGGDPHFPYAEPNGPDETKIMWSFLQQHQRAASPRRRAAR
jgi:poly(hydroxyalkanoate) depolymerase family esterase